MHAPQAVISKSRTSSYRTRGFTLVELLIATVVLAVGLLALTSAGAAIVKLESRGQLFARMAAAGETRLELLRSQRCEATSGASDSGGLAERWSVTQSASRTRVVVDSVAPDRESASAGNAYVFRSAIRC
jgi:prepilin-type N-terminal cleavage/methylation domain-containing protein